MPSIKSWRCASVSPGSSEAIVVRRSTVGSQASSPPLTPWKTATRPRLMPTKYVLRAYQPTARNAIASTARMGSAQTATRKSVRPLRRRGFTGGVSDVSSSGTAGAATSSSGTSTASMITAVMLSSPPAAFAASTRSCAARFGSGSRLRMLAISSGRTIVVRPSEQKRMRSPGWSWMGYSSTSTSGSMPSARVMTDRRGWTSACSRVSSPPRTISSTRLWSSVIWVSSPSRTRYARESPTCPTTRYPSLPRMPAVRVVPMPWNSWSDTDFSRTASLAPSIASRNG